RTSWTADRARSPAAGHRREGLQPIAVGQEGIGLHGLAVHDEHAVPAREPEPLREVPDGGAVGDLDLPPPVRQPVGERSLQRDVDAHGTAVITIPPARRTAPRPGARSPGAPAARAARAG